MRPTFMVLINRRRATAVLGGGARNTASCVLNWVDEKLFRSDIRTDPETGVARPGVPLNLTIVVQNSNGGGCAPLAGALVDIWHCDAIGTVVTKGQKFLRGYQVSDDAGQVQFLTIYPGWYGGRTIHIHVRVRTYSGDTVLGDFVTQIFFDDAVSNEVLSQAPYTRTTAWDTRNTNDMVYTGAANASRMLATLTKTATGYDANITIAASLQTLPTASACRSTAKRPRSVGARVSGKSAST